MTVEFKTKNFYEIGVLDEHGEMHVSITSMDSGDAMMRKICYMIAFDDCWPVEFFNIVYNGEIVHYRGWRPNMLMEFENGDGKTVYSREFPEFEH